MWLPVLNYVSASCTGPRWFIHKDVNKKQIKANALQFPLRWNNKNFASSKQYFDMRENGIFVLPYFKFEKYHFIKLFKRKLSFTPP